MKRKAILLASILTLTTTALSSRSVLRGAAATPLRPHQAQSITLTVFDWTSLSSVPTGRKIVALYQRMHPGIKVKLLPLPPGDPVVYQQSTLTAGTAPDIVVTPYSQQIFPDIPKGWWLDLTPYMSRPDPYVTGNKHWVDVFIPRVAQPTTFVGRYYELSPSAQDAAFFYNKDIFAKVGITHVPTTWAGLMADLARIKKASYIPELFYLGDTYPLGETGTVISLLESLVMTKTFQRMDLNHNGVIDIRELIYGIKHHLYSPMNADYREAWKLFQQWSQYWQPNAAGNKGYVNASATVAQQLFVQGNAAVVYQGEGFTAGLAQTKPKFHWGLFTFPQITPASSRFATSTRKSVGIWGAWNGYPWGIPMTTLQHNHLKQALDFMQWVTAPQNAVPIALEEGLLPTVTGWKPKGTDSINTLFFDLINHPAMNVAAEVSLGPQWSQQRIATEQNYITGVESLDQAMADMQRFTDQAADRAINLYHLSVP